MVHLLDFHRCFETPGEPGGGAPVLPPGALSAEEAQKLRNENLMGKVALAKAQALTEFSSADRELVEMYNGSPEEIRAFAEKLHQKAQAAVPPPSSTPPAPPAGQAPAPGPAPIPGPGEAGTPQDQETSERRLMRTRLHSNGLRTQIPPAEAEQAYQDGFREAWNQHMIDRRTGRSTVSAGDAAPVVQ